jgi:carbonic anhydrase/acetyltransferase-like protein (isoleucine patch superfamily)
LPEYPFEGRRPQVAGSAFVAPNATLVGDVTIEDGASMWYGAVIRGDRAPVTVRAGANVQDGAVVHCSAVKPTIIGIRATIAHLCVVHGATIGEEALIGNAAVVLDGAIIGRRALVGAASLVPAGMEIPDGMLAVGNPARLKRSIIGTAAEQMVINNPEVYAALAAEHRRSLDG